jgi:tRNA(Ile)-lysidine synthase
MEIKNKYIPFELHLAHIDHGWRKESQDEASALQVLAENANVPFHLCKVIEQPKHNLEAHGREKRLQFFRSLFDRFSYQALILAHHAEDQAETVLKRFLEGTSLEYLKGMKMESEILGMPIWRPLLGFRKRDIYAYLRKRNTPYFEDKTNLDEKFLRGRMRASILPFLEAKFGKNMVKTLCIWGSQSEHLSLYLKKRIPPFKRMKSPEGECIDFNAFYPLEPIEIQYFLTTINENSLTRTQIQNLTKAICNKCSNRRFNTSNGTFFFNKGCLYIQDKRKN